jgi:ABC-2 type transport system ATP-binding protein
LILDEPTSGLDPVGRRQVKDLIVELGRRNKTILLCSHLLAEVEDVCSRIGILFSGRMRAEGRVSELLKADSSLRISARAKDEQQAAQIVDCLNTTFGVLAEPADMAGQLESYFLQVIARANTEGEQVTGAEQSITLAPFLTQHISGAGGDHQAAQE